MKLSRRQFNRTFLATTSALALGVSAASAKTGITVHGITMAAPDVVCLEVWDADILHGKLIALNSPDPAGRGAYVRRNQIDGSKTPPTEYCRVVGFNADHLHFYDKILSEADGHYLDRPAADNVENYPTIGGQTVTKVTRRSLPRDQGFGWNGSRQCFSSFRHFIFLHLSGNLPPGGRYTVKNSRDAFPTIEFVFNDKVTRALGIHATQVGHRRADGEKLAYLSQWIPGYMKEGRVDFERTYGIKIAYIIDAGGSVQHKIPIKLRYKGTWIEPDVGAYFLNGGAGYTAGDVLTLAGGVGTPATIKLAKGGVNAAGTINSGPGAAIALSGISSAAGNWASLGDYDVMPVGPVQVTGGTGTGALLELNHCRYPSTTQGTLTVTGITKATPGVISYSGSAWAPTNGDIVQLRGIGGMTQIEGSTIVVSNVNKEANTFEIGFGSRLGSNQTFFTSTLTFGQYHHGSYLNGFSDLIYKIVQGNRANTFVYELDFTSFLCPQFGDYRIWIPSLGVSDTFRIDDAVHFQAAKIHAQGYYNQSTGIRLLSSVGGWERPQNLFDGANGAIIYESQLPGGFSSEAAVYGNNIAAGYSGQSPWITKTRAINWAKSIHDAGDLDFHSHVHCQVAYHLLEWGYRQLNLCAYGSATPPSGKAVDVGFPKASTLLDPDLYGGIDHMGDQIHMALLQADCFRRTQKKDGRVYGGMQFSQAGNGGGGSSDEPSFLINGTNGTQQAVALAACPAGCYMYAAAAAKIAQVFNEAGEISLSRIWQTSATSAFDWAESLRQDFLENGPTGRIVDGYFNGICNMQANAAATSHWSPAAYQSAIQSIFTSTYTKSFRVWAAGCLFNLTNSTSPWGNIATGSDAHPDFRFALPTSGFTLNAVWEACQAQAMGRYTYGGRNLQLDYYNARFSDGWTSVASQLSGSVAYRNSTNSNYLAPTSGPGLLPIMFLKDHRYPRDNSNPYLNLMHAAGNYASGANQNGLCCTVGLGIRNPEITLIRDREAMQVPTSSVRGITTYTWSYNNYPQIAIFNLANGNSPLNWTFNCPTSGNLALQETIEPYYPTAPATEQFYPNSYIVYCTEFTVEQSIAPYFVLALWRHCWDGNTATALSSRSFK